MITIYNPFEKLINWKTGLKAADTHFPAIDATIISLS